MKLLKNKKILMTIYTFLALVFCLSSGAVWAKYTSTLTIGSFNLYVEPQEQAYAVYSEDDNSLEFYYGIYPVIGTKSNSGKTVSAVYHDEIEKNTSSIPEWNNIASKIISVNFIDIISPISVNGWFSDFVNAETMDLNNLDTSNLINISDMENMFIDCVSLNTLKLGERFGNSNQTFKDIGFESIISGWTKASENDEIDYLCQNINLGTEETYSAVTYCYATYSASTGTKVVYIYQRKYFPNVYEEFYDGKTTYTVTYLLSWRKVSNGVDPVSEGCRSPRNYSTSKIISSSWDVHPGCNEIASVKVVDNIIPKTLHSWFKELRNCYSFDLKNINASQAVSMSYMFYDVNKPEIFDFCNFNTSNVKSMSYMFAKCWAMQEIDISSFDTSSVTSMTSMFDMKSDYGYDNHLKTIYVSNNFVTTQVTSSDNMFRNCTSLVGGYGTTLDDIKTIDSTNYLNVTYARIDSTDLPGYLTLK